MIGSKMLLRMRDNEGSTLMEMAFMLPMFLMLVVGTIQASIVLYNYCDAVYSVRIAARYASLHSDTSGDPTCQTTITNIVTGNLRLVGSGGNPAVLLDYGNSTNGNYVGDLVGVGVIWQNNPIYGGGPFFITAQAYRIISH
ncbi:MAG TPA: TadE/TadG family type IV pilus assembly protein [Terracidiphilus sp.]